VLAVLVDVICRVRHPPGIMVSLNQFCRRKGLRIFMSEVAEHINYTRRASSHLPCKNASGYSLSHRSNASQKPHAWCYLAAIQVALWSHTHTHPSSITPSTLQQCIQLATGHADKVPCECHKQCRLRATQNAYFDNVPSPHARRRTECAATTHMSTIKPLDLPRRTQVATIHIDSAPRECHT
jgi:hypothetical protein